MPLISSSKSFAFSICKFQAREYISSQRRGAHEGGTDRCGEINHRLSCDVGLLVVILDFNVDNMNRFVKVSAPRKEIYVTHVIYNEERIEEYKHAHHHTRRQSTSLHK